MIESFLCLPVVPKISLSVFFVLVSIRFSVRGQVLSYARIWLYLSLSLVIVRVWLIVRAQEQFAGYGRSAVAAALVTFSILSVSLTGMDGAHLHSPDEHCREAAPEAAALLSTLARPGLKCISAPNLSDQVLYYQVVSKYPQIEPC